MSTTSSRLFFLLALAFALAAAAAPAAVAAARGTPAPAPAPALPAVAAPVAAPAPAPAKGKGGNDNKKKVGEVHDVVWGFPHAPRPHLVVAPGDEVKFTWDQLHGVYALGRLADSRSVAGGRRSDKNAKEATCADFKNFHDAKKILAGMPRREGYYGPNHGSVSWTAPDKEGAYLFADPIEQNCDAGMLLVVDVEKPSAKGANNNNNNNKAAAAAAAAAAPVAAAPAPAPAKAQPASVSVASAFAAPPEPVSPEPVSPGIQEAFVEVEEQGPTTFSTTPRERHEARVAEREAAREERRQQRAIEEGRVDFEGSAQHVIED